MTDGSTITRERQRAMRREIDRRGIAMKAVSFDSGVPYSSLLSYFPADPAANPAMLPASALFMLCGALPDDILSLLLPDGRLIVQAPVEMDHDTVCEGMVEYLAEKQRAHHPESECGPAIGPNEDNVLRVKFARVKAA